MSSVTTFYFRRIAHSRVYSAQGKKIGRLKDIVVDLSAVNPRVFAFTLQNGRSLDSTPVDIVKDGRQYALHCREEKDIEIKKGENILYLARNILDRQIVDMDGRKVVRVNDLRLATVSTGTYLIAVDVGLEGLMRRLSVAKPIKVFLRLFHKSIPSRLILWNDVETVGTGNTGIRLSTESA
ncbi:MAG: PRC-barrel domain-containing protein, partial [Clostridia bacterium]|nr:PRC-barrel domain-containing protein [Clostridia bacterium]